MELKKTIEEIEAGRSEVALAIFVRCDVSQTELYPTKYFLEGNAKKLGASLHTINKFVHATPACVGRESIIITCSLGGNAPETVEASKKAMNMGAEVIAIAHTPDSPLANNAHCVVLHGFERNYMAKLEKMIFRLQLTAEIFNQYEGYKHYQDMVTGFARIFDLIENTVSFTVPSAKKFTESYKDAPVAYVMSSGATHMVIYSFFICLLMEVQWINSGPSRNGEFFHGPFGVVDKGIPFLLLINGGNTRALDSRALDFLNRFQAKTTLIGAKDFGLGSVIPFTVKDYFNPTLITAVLRVYAEQLAILRGHPLTQRRYIWKLGY